MRVELKSKLIDAAEYDQDASRLKLFMASGQIREFHNVPANVITELQASSSPGTYYIKLIRDAYERIA